MKQLGTTVVLAMLAGIFSGCSQHQSEFYVSPSGKDTYPGTLNKPFASIIKARNEVRELIKEGLDRNVVVYLREGLYQIDQTIVFGLKDGGTDHFTISYEAFPGEKPVLSSGISIKNWKEIKEYPDEFAEKSFGHVWVTDISEDMDLFYAMYDGEKLLPRARSEGFNSTKKMGPDIGIFAPDEEKKKVHFPRGTLKNWGNLSDIEIFTYPGIGWTVNMLHIESVDEDALIAKTTIPATYPVRFLKGRTPMQLPEGIWVENSLEFLDQPGEWVVNTKKRKIWYWPASGSPGDHIVVPSLKELIKVEGEIEIDGLTDVPVQNIHFRGITFMHAERDTWENGDRGIQHDWEILDKPTALMRFRGAENCSVEKCRFTSSGGTGLRLDLHCQEIIVSGNLFENLGNMGILLCGYGPGKKDVNHHNKVTNNLIRKCGEIYYHGHGIFAFQSGNNLIAHNTIYDMPRKAIGIGGVRPKYFENYMPDLRQCGSCIREDEIDWESLKGKDWFEMYPLLLNYYHSRDNIIEYNYCEDVLQKGADGAAINLTASGYGNIIRHNFVGNLTNPLTAGIRLDGSTRRTRIYNNILVNAHGILPKPPENSTCNNIIVFTEFQSKIPKKASPLTIFSGVKGRNVRNIAYFTTHPAMPDDRQKIIQPVINKLDSNIYYSVEMQQEAQFLLEELKQKGLEEHSIFADPLFMDILHMDFRLQDGSPLHAMGFGEILMDEIGITDDFPLEYK